MKCTLCGFEVDESKAEAACQCCAVKEGCELVKCPNCNFELVRDLHWLKRLFQKRKVSVEKEPGLAMPLNEAEINRKVQVSHIHMRDKGLLQKIIAIGALPKTELILAQKFPSYVLQIGRSQFCIDRELASCIYVQTI